MTRSLKDVYIVIDTSPRFQSVILVTFDRAEAEQARDADPQNHRIVQQSGSDFPNHFRY